VSLAAQQPNGQLWIQVEALGPQQAHDTLGTLALLGFLVSQGNPGASLCITAHLSSGKSAHRSSSSGGSDTTSDTNTAAAAPSSPSSASEDVFTFAVYSVVAHQLQPLDNDGGADLRVVLRDTPQSLATWVQVGVSVV
jgi:hypothetical protein